MTIILTLLQLFLRLKDKIVASRQATVRSSLNKLTKVLGYVSADLVLLEAFNLPIEAIYAKIDAYNATIPAEKQWGRNSLRNLKNDISYLLRVGREGETPLLPPPQIAGRLTRQKVKPEDLQRGEQYIAATYTLKESAPTLENQLATYDKYCTEETSFVRPASLKRKPVTMQDVLKVLLRFAGYLVKFQGVLAASLTLETLVTPNHVKQYIDWYVKQRKGKVSRTVYLILSKIQALLQYLMLTEPKKKRQYQKYAEQLKNYRQSLDLAIPVHVKEDRMIELKLLEQVGLSCYPEQAAQLKRLSKEDLAKHPGIEQILHDVMYSLIIRILARIPMRSRNIREMQWNPSHPERGQNLYRRGKQWHFRYVGKEIKIEKNSRQRDGVNRYEHPLPTELNDQLEEYLFTWYPVWLERQTADNCGREKIRDEDESPTGQALVFLNNDGCPLTSLVINQNFKTITRAYTGVAINIHMVRTIWATAYIKRTRDIMGAAFRLGDKPETVMKHYAHLLNADVQDRVEKFLYDTFS